MLCDAFDKIDNNEERHYNDDNIDDDTRYMVHDGISEDTAPSQISLVQKISYFRSCLIILLKFSFYCYL